MIDLSMPVHGGMRTFPRIVKPTLEYGFDYKTVVWGDSKPEEMKPAGIDDAGWQDAVERKA